MNKGSKIIIIEDEKSGISVFSRKLCSCLPCTEEEQEKRKQEWNEIPENMPKPQDTNINISPEDKAEYYFNQFNEFWKDNAICPKSFKDAYNLVESIGSGEDYEWIFIDRNLTLYHDIQKGEIVIGKKIFNQAFFGGINDFAGDYLFIMLVNAGVPIEKICFLTANTDKSIEKLSESPYLHKDRLPQIIDKNNNEELEKILSKSHNAKIRFLYKDIFENPIVEKIFDPYFDSFIPILAKRYKNPKKYDKTDGIVLRNMIEAVVAYISQNTEQSVRNYLNCSIYYNNLNKLVKLKFHTPNNVVQYIQNNKMPYLNDKDNIKTWLKGNISYFKNIKDQTRQDEASDKEADNMIEFATALNIYFCGQPSQPNSNIPPKYIFSYIDNIYTVTSEWSAHGRNNKTTNDLTVEGWEALLNGIIQILQWVASWQECTTCKGTGIYPQNGTTCPKCHGTGYIW